MGTKMAAKWTR